MGYHPRIESREISSLCTTRSRNSELWFINNPQLENAILGYVAKYRERYKIKLYAACLEGNHIHSLAQFPEANRAHFQRDLNSSVARAVARHAPTYPGGRFWARRYSNEFVPGHDDIEDRFFYTVLQPVHDGLVDRISDYPGYNCFSDAINGTARKFKVVNWGAYNSAKRWNRLVKITDFTEIVELKYERLPGYEDMPQDEYRRMMLEKLERRRIEAIAERGKPALGPEKLKDKEPGTLPRHTKVSTRTSHRPRVLSVCSERRQQFIAWYFDIYYRYKEASKAYRAGDLSVVFPEGTYRPALFVSSGASIAA
jgi:REP element-mobilizing transposase RayT